MCGMHVFRQETRVGDLEPPFPRMHVRNEWQTRISHRISSALPSLVWSIDNVTSVLHSKKVVLRLWNCSKNAALKIKSRDCSQGFS